jgi:putative DNA primase/helicase
MNDLSAFLAAFGCDQIYPLDATIYRFNRNGHKTGWFWGIEAFKLNSGEPYRVVIVGDWNGSERAEYRTNAVLTKEQKKDVNERLRDAKTKAEIEKIQLQNEVAAKANVDFEGFGNTHSTPYCDRKLIIGHCGTRTFGDTLIVPTRDVGGKLWGYQRILATGEKYFLSGQRKKGCFHALGPFESARIYMCEGFATASSIFQATGCLTISAFDAGNLLEVGKEIRKKYPQAEIIFAADNDQFTEKNPGVTAAFGATKAIKAKIVVPKFKDLSTKPTDFNDLHILEGLEEVARQLGQLDTKNDELLSLISDELYDPYKLFFDDHLKGAKKDIITKEFLKFDGEYWQSPLNNLDAIKSYAASQGLNPNKVQMHLDRYILEKPYELLIEVPKWDGKDRIKELALYIKFKDRDFSVFEDAFKEWGANVFRRLYAENMQNRCIILKGKQGLGKDRLLKTLLSGFKHYHQSFSVARDPVDCWDQVTESLVLHIEEFDQTGSMPVAVLKDMITRNTAKYRSKFARKSHTRKCVASFICSVNIDDILRDETGNRRFAVFEIEDIDWSYPKDFGTQIIAQFKALFDADFWAKPSTWDAVSMGNEKFEQVDIIPELLEMWDRDVGLIRDNKRSYPMDILTFGDVKSVVPEISKVFGIGTKKILGILKMHGRSKKSNSTVQYFSDAIKETLAVPSTDDYRSRTGKKNWHN